MKRLATWLRRDSTGATLTELLVYVGILSAFLASVGTAFFQALRVPPTLVDSGVAVNELRRGLGRLADDIQGAREATISADGALVLTWKNYYGGGADARTATYSLDEAEGVLFRLYDDGVEPVNIETSALARRVTAATFSIDEPTRSITATLTADAGQGFSEILSVRALMKPELP